MNTSQQPSFVVCVSNADYLASLEQRKIYEVVPDAEAEAQYLIRIVDESGEDYLYPSDYFRPSNWRNRCSSSWRLRRSRCRSAVTQRISRDRQASAEESKCVNSAAFSASSSVCT